MAKKEIKVKSYRTKDGKRVKQFRRRQKIAAGVAGVAAIGGLVAAAKNKKSIRKLVKNVKNKKENPITSVPPASLDVTKSSQPSKSNLDLRDDIPESIKPFLEDYDYKPPKESLLLKAKRPESYQSVISDSTNTRTIFYTPGSIGYVTRSGTNVSDRTKSLADNIIQKQGGELKDLGATAQFLELEDGSGFILQVEKTPKIQKGAVDNRIGSFFFNFKVPKDVDPRYIDLKPFDDLVTPENEGYSEELFNKLINAYNPAYKDSSYSENVGLNEANEYMLDFLKKADWKPLSTPNPKVKNTLEVREKTREGRKKETFDKKDIWKN